MSRSFIGAPASSAGIRTPSGPARSLLPACHAQLPTSPQAQAGAPRATLACQTGADVTAAAGTTHNELFQLTAPPASASSFEHGRGSKAVGPAHRVGHSSLGRRAWLATSAACLAAAAMRPSPAQAAGNGGGAAGQASAVDLRTIQEEAYLAYAERRFQDAVNLLTECIAAQPAEPRWREMRAEALVDGKNFTAALEDFRSAMEMVPSGDQVTQARLRSGRALAHEGLGEWEAALADYRRGMDLAAEAGESLDPYVLNSIGNCLNSLGRWQEAREQYLASAEVFQRARGFRGRNGSTTPRLDGAIFAASNAALMRAQLGDTDGAVQEMVRIARRAPGSADMRAALAALYWQQGRRQEAEEMWEFACDRITVGCTKYSDLDWLGRIRRWPPAMVERMSDFLAMR